MNTTKERYAVEFVALGDDSRPAIARLRALLKHSLRSLRLRCVAIREVDSTTESKAGKVQ